MAQSKSQNLSTYNIDEFIFAWDKRNDGTFIAPRGFLHSILKGLKRLNLSYELYKNVCRPELPPDFLKKNGEIELRTYQTTAIDKIVSASEGIYKAPPGSGKTIVCCGVIEVLQTSTLIIVDRINIAEQWIQSLTKYFGLSRENIGFIGDGENRILDISVALQQSLWSKRNELEFFYKLWGLVILDEAHHGTSDTFMQTFSSFPAAFRYGVTATPGKRDGYLPLAQIIIGPIIADTMREELIEAGVLTTPMIKKINTGFDFEYIGSHRDEITNKLQRNNYTTMIQALVKDKQRNQIIAEIISKDVQQGCSIIVNSNQIVHLDNIATKLIENNVNPEYVLFLTGKQNIKERKEVYERAAEGTCVILSTIGYEALDIPRLDRLLLVFPTSNLDIVRQTIGRIERLHPHAKDLLVYDLIDEPGPLRAQAQKRQTLYFKEKYRVIA